MNTDIRVNTPLLNKPQPPICFHILGQDLVNAIWQEGQDLKKDLDCADKQFITMKQERDAFWHKCKKYEEMLLNVQQRLDELTELYKSEMNIK